MGTEMAWVPIVASLVSAGATYMDGRQQQKRADRIALDSLQQTGERQRRADQVTNQMLQEIGASSPDSERQTTMRGFLEQLSRASPRAQEGIRGFGGESGAFQRDSAAAALGINEEGREYADRASRLDAPALQRRRESATMFDRGMDIGLIGREQQGADRTTNMRMSGIRSNPWLQALAAASSAYGQSYNPAAGASANQAQNAAAEWARNNYRGLAGVGW